MNKSGGQIIATIAAFVFFSCGDGKQKTPPEAEETPTSGKLKVYYNEALALHIESQVYTFEVLYPNVEVEAIPATESEAISLLLMDSCKAIVINRLFGEKESRAFAQSDLHPAWSKLALTGVALIVNSNSTIDRITVDQVKELLGNKLIYADTAGAKIEPIAVFDNKNSAVTRYLVDSLLSGKGFGPQCSATGNNMELLKAISENKNAIGFIDFAWLSDKSDSLYKAWEKAIRFVAVGRSDTIYFSPNQSSFKTGEYPFTRTIYYLRRTGDFTLAKGFESFMAGPKGQTLFLKQGLLPHRQQERSIIINTEPVAE